MPTKKDYILGRLAVERGYLTHEQIGVSFLDHQAKVEEQGLKIAFSEMLVVQGLLTGEQARDLEQAAAIEAAAARPGVPDAAPARTKERRPRRPSTRSQPPIRPSARAGGRKTVLAATIAGSGVVALALAVLYVLGEEPPDEPPPRKPVAVGEAEGVGGSAVDDASSTEPSTSAGETPTSTEDDFFAKLRRESEEQRTGETAAAGDVPAGASGGGMRAAGIRRGLVGHWGFDEEGSPLVTDLSGRAPPARILGAWRVEGVIGGALEFDGEDDHVPLPCPVRDDFTIAFWMKADRPGPVGELGHWWEGSGLVDAEVDGAKLDFGVSLRGRNIAFGIGGPDTTLRSGSAVADGEWHHVAATRVRASGETRIFIDGKLDASGRANTEALSDAPRLVAGSIQTGGNRFAGALDDVRIYDRALSPDEIRTLSDPELLAAAERALRETAPKAGPAARPARLATGIRSGLIAHWTFDEGEGTVAADSSGQKADGEFEGLRWTRGRVGGALEFDGTSGYVTCVQGPDLTGKSFTLCAWARRGRIGRFDMIASQGRDRDGEGLQFGFRDNDRFTFAFWNNDLDTADRQTDFEWHHWAATYDAANRERTIYMDGKVVAWDAAKADYAGTGVMDLGGRRFGARSNFLGLLDDVRVYGRALKREEIGTLADPKLLAAAELIAARGVAPAARPAAAADVRRGLVGHWTFDEGVGAVAGDSSGRGLDAAVLGASWARGRVGRALEFDGADDYVDVGRTASELGVDGGRPRSICFWMQSRRRDPGGVYDLGSVHDKEDFSVRCETDASSWRMNLWGEANDFTFTQPTLDVWAHLAVVYDGARVTVYGNGVLLASKHVVLNTTDGKPFAIGRWMFRGGDDIQYSYYCGLIDDVRVYDRALSTEEIGMLAEPQRLAERPEAAEGPAAPEKPPAPTDLLAPFFASFQELVAKEDYAAAGELMENVAKDEELAAHAEEARAAVRVCGALASRREAARRAASGLVGTEVKLATKKGPVGGKVTDVTDEGMGVLERLVVNRVVIGESKRALSWSDLTREQIDELAAKGGWEPRSPDDHMALAIVAFQQGDARATAAALRAVGDHPLVARYRGSPGGP